MLNILPVNIDLVNIMTQFQLDPPPRLRASTGAARTTSRHRSTHSESEVVGVRKRDEDEEEELVRLARRDRG